MIVRVRVRPSTYTCADDTSDHGRRPRLERRESSARGAGRAWKVAGAGSREARALTAAQPRSQQRRSTAAQAPLTRGPIRSRRPSRSEAARNSVPRSPLSALHPSHSTRLTIIGRGWQALRRVTAEHHQSVLDAFTAPPRLLLRTVADPRTGRGAGVHFFCRPGVLALTFGLGLLDAYPARRRRSWGCVRGLRAFRP